MDGIFWNSRVELAHLPKASVIDARYWEMIAQEEAL